MQTAHTLLDGGVDACLAQPQRRVNRVKQSLHWIGTNEHATSISPTTDQHKQDSTEWNDIPFVHEALKTKRQGRGGHS